MGIIERGRQGLFFSFLVMSRSVLPLCAGIKAPIGIIVCHFMAAYNISSHVIINQQLSIAYQQKILCCKMDYGELMSVLRWLLVLDVFLFFFSVHLQQKKSK